MLLTWLQYVFPIGVDEQEESLSFSGMCGGFFWKCMTAHLDCCWEMPLGTRSALSLDSLVCAELHLCSIEHHMTEGRAVYLLHPFS